MCSFQELATTDIMLDAFREILYLEREHPLGVITPQQLNHVVGLLKNQLAKQEKRQAQRAEKGEDEDEEGGDDEEKEAEVELLKTVCNTMEEILRQHGKANTWVVCVLHRAALWAGGVCIEFTGGFTYWLVS